MFLKTVRSLFVGILIAVLCAALAGCGSGGSSGLAASSPGTGRMVMAIQFPASPSSRARGGAPKPTFDNSGVPIGTAAVKIEVGSPAAYSTASDSFSSYLTQPVIVQDVNGAAGSGTTQSISIDELPAGTVRVRVTAWSNSFAVGYPIGEVVTGVGSTFGTSPPPGWLASAAPAIQAGQADPVITAEATTSVSLNMATTAVFISIIPGPTVSGGDGSNANPFVTTTNPLSLSANVMDAGGNPLIGLPLLWSATADSFAPSNSGPSVLATLSNGTQSIQVQEQNTGITQTVWVSYSSPP